MKLSRIGAATVTALVVVVPLSAASVASAAPRPRDYPNCAALNRVYPHGVGKFGARDKTSGAPVRNFTRNNRVYALNAESDRDKDGIACEKR